MAATTGPFRWPSLATASVAPPRPGSLVTPQLRPLVLHALIDKLTERLAPTELEQHQLLAVAQLGEDLPEQLHHVVGFRGNVAMVDAPTGPPLIAARLDLVPQAPVFVLTDIVVSGYTVRRLAKVLERGGHHVRAVIAVVDMRNEFEAPIELFERRIPVWSISHAPVVRRRSSPGAKRAVPIDEGREAGTLPEPTFVRDRIEPDAFHAWCRDAESALLFGHFARRRDRHALTFLDLEGLVESTDELVGTLVQAIEQWPPLSQHEPTSVDVFYPRDDVGFAELLAISSVKILTEQHRSARAYALERHEGQGDLRFRTAATGSVDGKSLAVFIDWGAVTTRTVRRAVAALADLGYRCVKVILATSQLTPLAQDEIARVSRVRAALGAPAGQLALLEAPAFESASTTGSESCEIDFEVLTHLSMALSEPDACRPCLVVGELREIQRVSPTDLIASHLEHKIFAMRAKDAVRSIREARRDGGVEFFGERLDPAACVDVFEVRSALDQATMDTAAREEVRRRILALPNEPTSEVRAWLRLLALESSWLHVLPLDLPECRQKLAAACIQILMDENADLATAWQAAMVLRGTSKRQLIQRFPDLLRSRERDDLVVAELVLGLLTLIRRPYHQSVRTLGSVIRSVHSARQDLADRSAATRPSQSRDLDVTLHALQTTAESLSLALEAPTDPLDAWDQLTRSYCEPLASHARVTTAVLVVDDSLNGPLAIDSAASEHPEMYDTDWRGAVEAWEDCITFLSRAVFPLFPALQGVLMTATLHGSGVRLRMDHEEWPQVLQGGGVEKAWSLHRRLSHLASHPEEFDERRRRDLSHEFAYWYEYFLRPPERDAQSGALKLAGHLYTVALATPANVGDCITAATERARAMGLAFIDESPAVPELAVFCDRVLLEDVLVQLFVNAAGPQHPKESRPTLGPGIRVEMERNNGWATIHFLNDWSEPSDAPGTGLQRFAELLSTFGAELSGQPLSDDRRWTFEAVITLPTWTRVAEHDADHDPETPA